MFLLWKNSSNYNYEYMLLQNYLRVSSTFEQKSE